MSFKVDKTNILDLIQRYKIKYPKIKVSDYFINKFKEDILRDKKCIGTFILYSKNGYYEIKDEDNIRMLNIIGEYYSHPSNIVSWNEYKQKINIKDTQLLNKIKNWYESLNSYNLFYKLSHFQKYVKLNSIDEYEKMLDMLLDNIVINLENEQIPLIIYK